MKVLLLTLIASSLCEAGWKCMPNYTPPSVPAQTAPIAATIPIATTTVYVPAATTAAAPVPPLPAPAPAPQPEVENAPAPAPQPEKMEEPAPPPPPPAPIPSPEPIPPPETPAPIPAPEPVPAPESPPVPVPPPAPKAPAPVPAPQAPSRGRPPAPTSPDATQITPKDQSDLLTLHNTYRAQHGVSTQLTYNPTLAQQAAIRAQILAGASGCVLQHGNLENGVGQNLSQMSATYPLYNTPMSDLVKGWTDESVAPGLYNHATQMLWATTKEVGCAKAFGSGTRFKFCEVLVCDYFPAGNWVGSSWLNGN
ncbi:hypothetical protein HDU98_010147 [Podochytrium sp. JEL0797]|nr:hypothetical protein HDU98_010147 [Podochytrium sp. JEL0797]